MESNLQIISGRFRGRKLFLPPDARPTQNRARIALFNMMESGVFQARPNLIIWDAFAGSGAFGLECLSRYQGVQVLFTDNSPTSLQTIRSNLSLLGLGAIARIRKTDAMMAIPTYGGMVDLVFLDPPYAHPEMGLGFLKGLARVAKRGMIVIWEQDAQNAVAPNEKKWNIVRDKTYGRARFLILQKK
ncbi:MAG: hypothetical protein E7009_00135 [Alphaproteobacteria bacterium]|nr:hypothetical protein [Alphaproteobacteria bacterium]